MESNKSYFRGSHVGVCFVGGSYLRYPAMGANISHRPLGSWGPNHPLKFVPGWDGDMGQFPGFQNT